MTDFEKNICSCGYILYGVGRLNGLSYGTVLSLFISGVEVAA